MTTQTIVENEFATLMYHTDTKILHHIFHKQIKGEAFRHLLNSGIEVLQEHGATKWLSDDRLHVQLPEEDTIWAKTDFFPRAMEAGWQHWAIVMPPRALALLNLKEFIDSYRPFGLHVMVFKDDKQALKWLELSKSTSNLTKIPQE